eukprot:403370560
MTSEEVPAMLQLKRRLSRQPSICRENPYPTILRRASSRQFLREQQRLQNQLELQKYNQARSIFESKFELPTRQIHLRRLAQELLIEIPEIYKYPIYNYVEDCAKHLLINDIELLNWYEIILQLFSQFENQLSSMKQLQIRVLIYQAGRIIKRIYKSDLAESIDTYLSNFQFTNFKELFNVGGTSLQKGSGSTSNRNLQLYFSQYDFQASTLQTMNQNFNKLRRPLEVEESQNFLNYNWIVDNILKNSTPYETNKDTQNSQSQGRGRKKMTPKAKSMLMIQKRGRKPSNLKKMQSFSDGKYFTTQVISKRTGDTTNELSQSHSPKDFNNENNQSILVSLQLPKMDYKTHVSTAQQSANYLQDSTNPDVENQIMMPSTHYQSYLCNLDEDQDYKDMNNLGGMTMLHQSAPLGDLQIHSQVNDQQHKAKYQSHDFQDYDQKGQGQYTSADNVLDLNFDVNMLLFKSTDNNCYDRLVPDQTPFNFERDLMQSFHNNHHQHSQSSSHNSFNCSPQHRR